MLNIPAGADKWKCSSSRSKAAWAQLAVLVLIDRGASRRWSLDPCLQRREGGAALQQQAQPIWRAALGMQHWKWITAFTAKARYLAEPRAMQL